MDKLSRLSPDRIIFPGLGIDMNVSRDAFSIFGFSVKWYGLMIAAGLLLAMMFCFPRARRFGIDTDRLIDAVIAGVIGAVIGARGYYVALHADQYHDIKEILATRDGGLAIYGGIMGALLFGCITAKIRGVKVLPAVDLASMGFFIGQACGRWGNFFNQECFGGNTTLPWGMSGGRVQSYLLASKQSLAAQGMTVDPYLPVHPCFLYESLWCALGLVVLIVLSKHRKFDGQLFCTYVLWYGTGRFFIEGLRTDSLYLGGVRASQMLAAVSAAAALVIIIIGVVRAKKNGVHLYCDTEESKAIIAAADAAEAEEKAAKAAKKQKKNELTGDQKIIDDDEESES